MNRSSQSHLQMPDEACQLFVCNHKQIFLESIQLEIQEYVRILQQFLHFAEFCWHCVQKLRFVVNIEARIYEATFKLAAALPVAITTAQSRTCEVLNFAAKCRNISWEMLLDQHSTSIVVHVAVEKKLIELIPQRCAHPLFLVGHVPIDEAIRHW